MNVVLLSNASAEIVQLEARLREAQLRADVEALGELIADDLLFAGPDGRLATKEQDLDAHRTGVVRFLEHEPLELHVRRVSDDVAVASLEARLVVDVAGTRTAGVYRYTRVWAREGVEAGTWRVVGGQVSEIAR
jgi:ketosteroid isomerase-like protein